MTATGSAISSWRPYAPNGDTAASLRPPAGADPPRLGLLEELRAVHGTMLDAALRGAGLVRVAELAASAVRGTVAVVIPRRACAIAPGPVDSIISSALGQWVQERIRGRPAAVPADVLAEAPICLRDELVGVVALLRTDRPPRPEALEFLHLAAAAALMELAIEDAREETEQQLRGSFLEELRSRQELDGPEIVRRGARLGCDLSSGAVILCAELTSDRPRMVAAMICSEHPGALAQPLDGIRPDAPPRVYAALPATVGDRTAAATLASARQLAGRLQRHAIVGLSSFHADAAELGGAVQEAELVLEVLQQSGAPNDEIGSGTYKLLFRMLASHPEEVRLFYDATVAAVVRYDDQYRTELIRTLQAYLDANCNMNAAAAAIFAHRHTVAYRLERVRELTGLDPTRSEHRERLGLGLKVHRIVAPRLPSLCPEDRLG